MQKTPEQIIRELTDKIKELELQLQKAKDNAGYGLKREEKTEIFEERAQNALPLLKEEKDLFIHNNADLDHLIIEGDNYHILSVLNYTHKGKIDVIYIDPPYNTGNRDFVYNDNYVDPEDGYRHSKRLSFMGKRLKLAKELLTDEGVIYISIDENEFAQLKLLSDEIFGEKNFIENFIWIKNATKNLSKTTSTNHEYVLCYAKNKSSVEEKQLFRKEKDGLQAVKEILAQGQKKFSTAKAVQDELRAYYRAHPELKGISMYNNVEYSSELKGYLMYTLSDLSAPKATGTAATYEILHPKTGRPCKCPSSGWRFTRASMDELIQKNQIEFYEDENHVPRFKRYLDTVETEVIKSYITDNTDGKKELARIFGECPFGNPKPTTLIEYLLLVAGKNSIILDFFAGSGTTGHAVLELNKQDGGSRQFILCSNAEATNAEPEKNICRNITYERVKRVMQGYTNAEGDVIQGLGGGNLRYYTTEFIKKEKATDDLRQKFIYLCDELLCIKEDTFTILDSDYCSDQLRCYYKKDHYTVILYDVWQMDKLQQLIAGLNGQVSLYLFSLSKDAYEEELLVFRDKVKIENVPDDILETYHKIF